MLRSYTLALLLIVGAAPSCSDLPDTVEPKPGGAGTGAGNGAGNGAAAGKSGASGATAGKGGSAGKGGKGGKDDHRDAGPDEDASS